MKPADEALDDLCVAVQHAQTTLDALLARAELLRSARGAGESYREIVDRSSHPLVVELLTIVLDELAVAGAAFRRAEARELRAEGLSQQAIASLFGVTRQRVSVLLRGSAGEALSPGPAA